MSAAHAQGNAEAAKGKNSMCIGCHGIPMYRTAFPEVYSVPMIAGQAPDYIVRRCKPTGQRPQSSEHAGRREKPLRPGHGRPRCLLWRHVEGGQMNRVLILGSRVQRACLLRGRCGLRKAEVSDLRRLPRARRKQPRGPDFPRLAGQYYDYS